MTVPSLRVAVLPGDGIGPEVTAAAVEVLETVARHRALPLETREFAVGWAGVRESGSPLPGDTLEGCRRADAVLLGAVGHPDARDLPPHLTPEAGLLRLRAALGCHTNLRPVRLPDAILDTSPLRPERVRGTDLVIVRELAGGLYYGEPRGMGRGPQGDREAVNTLRYSGMEVRRVAEAAFRLAAGRRRRLVSVDKANVLETSRLWRSVVEEVAREHPEVELTHMLVDRAAMELVLRPAGFDVLLMENLFGDILSDQAAGVVGSLGLLGSASLGGQTGLYEPVHGSAPELAGRGVANPVGAILSAALLLRWSAGLEAEARAVEAAVDRALAAGARTSDIAPPGVPGRSTQEVTRAVVSALEAALAGELESTPEAAGTATHRGSQP